MDNRNKKERQLPYTLVLILAIFSAGIIITGYFYYKNYEKQYRTRVEQQLSAIGKLKADELVNWRQERLGYAGIFYKNEAFSSLVLQYLKNPEDTEGQDILRTWLDKILSHTQCDRVSLLDANGIEKLSAPVKVEPIASVISRNTYRVLQLGLMTFTDFYRDEYNQKIYLNILVPIFAGPDDNLGVGVLVLRIDPEQYLYPLINSWPIPSLTAETLLIRRHGDNVLFLNELKFKKNTALTLQSSITNEQMPAVKAILGHKGIVDGIGYNGIPVIADIRPIPDSPWFIVARMDTSEVYAPLENKLWNIIGIICLLLSGIWAGVGLIWRQQQSRIYKEKYEAVETLRQSEERLRLTTEATEVGIWDWNLVTNELKWDERSNQLLGLSADTPQSYESLMSCIHPEDRQSVEEKISTVLKKKQDYIAEYRVVDNNGSIRWLFARGRGFYDENNKAVRISGTAIDITKRKQTEEVQQQLVSIIESAHDFIGYANAKDKHIIYINASGRRLCGISKGEDVTKLMISDIHPEWTNKMLADTILPAASRDGAWNGECAFLNIKDKHEIPVQMVLTAHAGPSGDIESFSTISRDITERKCAEELLKNSEINIRELFEHMSSAVAVYEPVEGGTDFVFEDCNETLLCIEKVSREQIIGRKVTEVFPAVKKFGILDVFARVCKTGNPEHFPVGLYEDQRISGWRENYVYKLPSGKMVAIYDDITERKKAEETLEKLNKDLKATIEKLSAANRELQEFTHITAHDLRAPLRTIGTLAEWLVTDYADKFDEQGRNLAHLLTDRAERMSEQINDIFTYSEIGRVTMETSEVDLNELITEVTDGIAPPENIKVVIDGQLPTIMCEKVRMTQVFQNLISNSVRFMDKPSGLITISFVDEGDWRKFSVTDNGPGIEEKYFEKIFRIFQTLSINDVSKGTGIGLAIVKKIVESYSGKVWVESKAGQGSAFMFTLPKQKQPQEVLSNG